MTIRVICVLTYLVSLQTVICLSAISGCTNLQEYDISYGSYNSYYSVQLSCSYNSKSCTMSNCHYWYSNCDSYYTSSCKCYRRLFSNGYNSNVKKLKPCSGDRLDETLPVQFKVVEIYDISSTGVEALTSTSLNFESLQKLDARDNKLTNISGSLFIQTMKLEEIDFSNNNINGLYRNDFKGASMLSTINFSHNNISIIETGIFTHTVGLTNINIANNKLSNLDKNMFSELIELTQLDLSYNSIQVIDEDMFQNNTKLQQLNLKNNPIYRIDRNILVPLSNSALVDVSLSNIKEFDSTCLEGNLQFFMGFAVKGVSGNYVEFYDQQYLKNLKYFNISGNQLQNASEIIKYLGSPIETLDVSSNFMGGLTEDTFKKFINLKYVNLRNTRLITIDPYTFKPLLEIDRKLDVLILSNNPIKRLDANVFLPMINSVDVQVVYDYVEEIDTSCIGNALKIDLSDKDEIVFTVTNHTFKLYCIKERFKQLTYFNISGNHLQNGLQIINWLGNTIKTLDLSSNFVGKINAYIFEKVTELQYLNLSNTQLSNFDFTTFYHLNKLKSLDISYNHLGKVDFSLLFRNFKDLEILNLEGNDLTNIDSITRPYFPNLSTLGISKNNLSCHYLAKFLLPWQNLRLFHNPSNQTHIDGIDCRHQNQDTNDDNDNVATVATTTKRITISSEVNSSTAVQRTTENSKPITSDDFINQTTGTEDKPTKRFDCSFLLPITYSEIFSLSCDHIEEIDTSCMENSLQIFNDNEEIVFHLLQTNSELRCTEENFQKLKYLNISGNQLQNTSQLIALLGSSIETLDVSSNFIGIPNAQIFKGLTNLKYLNLSSTNLSSFAYATFFNQQKLQVLDLSFNHLKKIDFIKFLRNFRHLNTLNVEGNDLTETKSISKTIFPKLSSLGISKNNFSCDYLATFLLQWDNLHLVKNPSGETHIDGVDCHEETQSITKNENKIEAEITGSTAGIYSSTPNSTRKMKDIEEIYENYKPVDIESSSLSADVRVLKYLFVSMFVMCFGYLVMKSKLIQKIRLRLAHNSLESSINQQFHQASHQDSTHTSVFELAQRKNERQK